MVFLWLSDGFPMVVLWFSAGFLVVSYDFQMVSDGFLVIFLWLQYYLRGPGAPEPCKK